MGVRLERGLRRFLRLFHGTSGSLALLDGASRFRIRTVLLLYRDTCQPQKIVQRGSAS